MLAPALARRIRPLLLAHHRMQPLHMDSTAAVATVPTPRRMGFEQRCSRPRVRLARYMAARGRSGGLRMWPFVCMCVWLVVVIVVFSLSATRE